AMFKGPPSADEIPDRRAGAMSTRFAEGCSPLVTSSQERFTSPDRPAGWSGPRPARGHDCERDQAGKGHAASPVPPPYLASSPKGWRSSRRQRGKSKRRGLSRPVGRRQGCCNHYTPAPADLATPLDLNRTLDAAAEF